MTIEKRDREINVVININGADNLSREKFNAIKTKISI